MMNELKGEIFEVPALLKNISAGPETCTTQVLGRVIIGLSHLLATQEFKQVDSILKNLEPEGLGAEVLRAVARTTFPFRYKLSEWTVAVLRISQELNLREGNPDTLLSRLINGSLNSSPKRSDTIEPTANAAEEVGEPSQLRLTPGVTCWKCHGRGHFTTLVGMMVINANCSECEGSGKITG